MAKLSDIANIMAAMKTFYPNYNPEDTEKTAVMLMKILGDLTTENLQSALLLLCSESRQFAPSAGEIRQTALKLNAKAAGIPDAWQAYDEVRKMPETGEINSDVHLLENGTWGYTYAPLPWSHPIVERVARMMGWPDTFPTEMPAADRSQFLKAYEAELSRFIDENGRLKIVADYMKSYQKQIAESENEAKRLLPDERKPE